MKLTIVSTLCLIGLCMADDMKTVRVRIDNVKTAGAYLEFRRCGDYYAFTSNPYDSSGHREYIYTVNRQSWIVNGPTKTGRLIEDNGASYKNLIPVFADSITRPTDSMIEWGKEYLVFKKTKLTSVQTKKIAGTDYYFTTDSIPRRMVVVRNGDTLRNFVYEKYETNKCVVDSFYPPNDVDFSEASAQDINPIMQEWTLPSSKKSFSAFTNYGVLLRLNYMGKMMKPSSELPIMGFLKGMQMKLTYGEMGELLNLSKDTVGKFGFRMFVQATKMQPALIWGKKIEDPSEFDFCWGNYYATRNLNNIKFIASAFSTDDSSFAKNLSSESKRVAKGSAAWSMQSHLKMLPFFAEDMQKVMNSISDREEISSLKQILEDKE